MARFDVKVLVRLWLVTALLAIPLRLFLPTVATIRAVVPEGRVAVLSESHDVVDGKAALAEGLPDIFAFAGLSQAPAERSGEAERLSGTVPPAMVSRMRLSAIVGPPWRAVVEMDGSQAPPRVVEPGDSILAFRVLGISADTRTLRRNGVTSRHPVSGSWTP
jgi:hypothetical protein